MFIGAGRGQCHPALPAPLSACELPLGLEQRFSESGPRGCRGTQERVREAGSQGPPSQSGGSLESGAGPSSPYGSESPGDAPAQQSMRAPDLEYNFGICLESRHSKEPSCVRSGHSRLRRTPRPPQSPPSLPQAPAVGGLRSSGHLTSWFSCDRTVESPGKLSERTAPGPAAPGSRPNVQVLKAALRV